MEVRWFRERFDMPVHLYLNQKNQVSRQDGAYWHRTALSPSALQTGDISLHLRNLRPSDRGVYTCLADDGRWNQGQTELIVRALGTQPSISMDSTQGEQTRLVCRSEGWSPEPEVIWRDRDGNNVTSLSNTTLLRVSQGLLSVSSYIKIKPQSNVFSCLVRSKTPKPDWESKLHISSDFFPGVSGWMVAFFLTLALSIGAIPLLVIQWRRMDVDVTLDPDTAQPELTLSAEGKQVRRGETWQDLPHNPERFDYWSCVLGREGFTSGRHYWQVQVEGNKWWRLGVSRASAQRKGEFSTTPQQGYWAVWWGSGVDEFTALTDPRTPIPRSLKPQKLGVYLDYEEGRLSFYNVETRSHIYTFTDMEFNPNEKLYPFFYTYSSEEKEKAESERREGERKKDRQPEGQNVERESGDHESAGGSGQGATEVKENKTEGKNDYQAKETDVQVSENVKSSAEKPIAPPEVSGGEEAIVSKQQERRAEAETEGVSAGPIEEARKVVQVEGGEKTEGKKVESVGQEEKMEEGGTESFSDFKTPKKKTPGKKNER
ncbi:UNVERIFIED_CONTAM: hypothetical protein FKN15_016698 [Acipenser sinensis]